MAIISKVDLVDWALLGNSFTGHIEYQLQVKSEDPATGQWHIYRSFSSLEELHRKISIRLGYERIKQLNLSFPTKSFLNSNASLAADLQAFINKVLQIDELSNDMDFVYDFFDVVNKGMSGIAKGELEKCNK